jgi:iron complex transport system substrate-binding protein
MKMKWNVGFVLALLFCVVQLAPCVGMKDKSSAAPTGMRIIRDLAGNDVELPVHIDRVLITSIWPLPAVYCYFMNSTEKLIGIPEVARSVAEGSIFSKIYPDILNLETGFINGTTINVEEVLRLKPDVVFYTGEGTAEYDLLKNAGIPAVGFTTAMKGDGNVAVNIEEWLRQLEVIFGKNDRVEKLISYNQKVYEELQQTLRDVPENEKPMALIIFTHTPTALQAAGNGHYSAYWLASTGARNAADMTGIQNIDIERVLSWSPDIIYLTNFSPIVPADLLENRISGFDWSEVPAVRNGKVYKFPLGTYRSYAPSIEFSVVLKWMAAKNNPALFKHIDIDREIAVFYQEFYGYTMTQSDLDTMLRPGAMVTQMH